MKNLFFLFSFISSQLIYAQVNFIKVNSLDELFKKAKSEKKAIYIDGYTNWCGWCKVLDKEVFTDNVFADTLHKYFIPVKLEMEKDSLGVIIARKFAIRSFPSALVINGDGYLVEIMKGYSPLDGYKNRLNAVIKKLKNQEKVSGYSANFILKFPPFYYSTYPMPGGKREKIDSVSLNTYLSKQKTWNNEIVWSILNTNYFLLNTSNQQRLANNLQDFALMFGEDEVNSLYMRTQETNIQSLINAGNEADFINNLNEITKKIKSDNDYEFTYKSEYYKKQKDYVKLVAIFDEYVNDSSKFKSAYQINETAWELYTSCNDTLLLNKAIGWMRNCVLLIEPSYNYIDTYASLLFKTGKLDEAKAQAKLAVKVGKSDNENTDSTEKLLIKIESALAKTNQ
jgi:thioredoxin-related protein